MNVTSGPTLKLATLIGCDLRRISISSMYWIKMAVSSTSDGVMRLCIPLPPVSY